MAVFTPPTVDGGLPEFAKFDKVDPTSGQNNVQSPEEAQRFYGWPYFRVRPARGLANWLARQTYRCLQYWHTVFWPEVEAFAVDATGKFEKLADAAVVDEVVLFHTSDLPANLTWWQDNASPGPITGKQSFGIRCVRMGGILFIHLPDFAVNSYVTRLNSSIGPTTFSYRLEADPDPLNLAACTALGFSNNSVGVIAGQQYYPQINYTIGKNSGVPYISIGGTFQIDRRVGFDTQVAVTQAVVTGGGKFFKGY